MQRHCGAGRDHRNRRRIQNDFRQWSWIVELGGVLVRFLVVLSDRRAASLRYCGDDIIFHNPAGKPGFPWWEHSLKDGDPLIDPLPALSEWYDRMKARPSYNTAIVDTYNPRR